MLTGRSGTSEKMQPALAWVEADQTPRPPGPADRLSRRREGNRTVKVAQRHGSIVPQAPRLQVGRHGGVRADRGGVCVQRVVVG